MPGALHGVEDAKLGAENLENKGLFFFKKKKKMSYEPSALIRVTTPRVKIKVRSWKLELLANISEGRETPSQQEFCVITYSLLFFRVALDMAAMA